MSDENENSVAYETDAKGNAVKSRTGLKVRREAAEEVKVVNKPRKMKLVKPRRIKNEVSSLSNPSLLVFPTDRLGITSEIKGAMIRAAGKVGTDKAALDLVDETLRILRGHLQARYKENVTAPVLKARVDTSVKEEVESDQEEAKTPVQGSDGSETVSKEKAKAEPKPKAKAKSKGDE